MAWNVLRHGFMCSVRWCTAVLKKGIGSLVIERVLKNDVNLWFQDYMGPINLVTLMTALTACNGTSWINMGSLLF